MQLHVPLEASQRGELPRPLPKINVDAAFLQANSGEIKRGAGGREVIRAAEVGAVLRVLDAAAAAGQGDAAANNVTLPKGRSIILKIF